MLSSGLKDLGYSFKAVVHEASGEVGVYLYAPEPASTGPLISCIMPTRGGLMPAKFAIDAFRRQTYSSRELIVVCRESGSEVERYLEKLKAPRIRFAVASDARNVGDLRNFAIAMSRGELICVWDDDDLSARDRLETQFGVLRAFDSDASFLLREMVWAPHQRRLAVTQARLFQENTMMIKRAALPPYPSVVQGGDHALVSEVKSTAKIVTIDDPAAYIYVYHGNNIWGLDHFNTIFRCGSRLFEGEQYDRKLAQLSYAYPILAYEEGLRGRRGGRGAGEPDPCQREAPPAADSDERQESR